MNYVYNRLSRIAVTLLFTVLFGALPLVGAKADWSPTYTPSINVTKLTGEIKVDGNLNEEIWKQVGVTNGFSERYPGDRIEPLVETEVYVAYDDAKLYVGFIAHDNPEELRSTMCQRDQFSGDDYVAVFLDPYGNAAWAYEFYVNPYGIQRDRLLTYVGSTMQQDYGFDMIWESAAKITSVGYSVEIAIPFSSIRFPNQDVQTWKVNFERFHPRDINRMYTWAAIDRNEQCTPCQYGTIGGMTHIQPGKGFEVLPAMVAQQAGYYDGSDFYNEDADGEMALTGKYSINSDVTLEAALNPDFSQIEADAAQVDVNSPVALLYPERRPFFQEGSDIFSTLFNSFNTRNILDPQLAVKLTGRNDDFRYGFLSAIDQTTPYIVPTEEGSRLTSLDSKSYVNVFRVARTLGTGVNSHNVGLLIGDRRYDGGGSNSIASFDMTFRLSRNYSIDGQYIYTHSEEPTIADSLTGFRPESFDNGNHTVSLDGESYSGFAMISRFLRRSNNWNFTFDYDQVGPSYQTQIGWDPWNDYRNASFATWYNFFVRKGILQIVTPQVYVGRRWNFDDQQKFENINFGANATLSWANTQIGIFGHRDSERWYGIDFDNLDGFNFNINSRPIQAFSYYIGGSFEEIASLGTVSRADQVQWSGSISLQPIDRLIVSPSITSVKANEQETDLELFRQEIFRTRLQYQFTRSLSLRLVIQHNDAQLTYLGGTGYQTYQAESWEVDPLITYRISPFSVFFIGSTYDIAGVNSSIYSAPKGELDERHFFMKLQYLFQV